MAIARIDLNSDLGEGFGPWRMGDDEAVLSMVTSANVACGGHAGDPDTMYDTLATAAKYGVTVGAHPGYTDRQGFGRRIIPMSGEEIGRMIAAQIGALQAIARLVPIEVRYVKPHGALGNLAAADPDVASAIVDTVQRLAGDDRPLSILAISGTELEVAARRAGLDVYSEIFADRAYLSTGQLVPRSRPDAMVAEPGAAVERLLGFLETGCMPVVDGDPIPLSAQSICVHGDSPHAVEMTRVIRDELSSAGVRLCGFAASDTAAA